MVRPLTRILLLALIVSACGGPGGPPLSDEEQLGQRLFTQHCASCHATAPDTVIVGPSLAGIVQSAGARVEGQDARAYIESSILAPAEYLNEGYNDVMPKTFGRILTGEELDAIIAYLYTLE